MMGKPKHSPDPNVHFEDFSSNNAKMEMGFIRLFSWVLDKVWRSWFSSLVVTRGGTRRLRQAIADMHRQHPRAALLVLPTHRSHVDYLLVSYLFFGLDLPVPHIGAGENLNIPVLGSILSHSGAFFIKRANPKDGEYKKWLRVSVVVTLYLLHMRVV